MRRFRAYYGRGPLHLLATAACFVIIVVAFVDWFHARTHSGNIVVWLAGALVAVELVLFPLGWVLDRISRAALGTRRGRPPRGAGWAYVRVPALLSGLLLIVFLPLIFEFSVSIYSAYTGSTPGIYLVRWLLASAAMFACSALLYGFGLVRRRSTGPSDTDDHRHGDGGLCWTDAPRRELDRGRSDHPTALRRAAEGRPRHREVSDDLPR